MFAIRQRQLKHPHLLISMHTSPYTTRKSHAESACTNHATRSTFIMCSRLSAIEVWDNERLAGAVADLWLLHTVRMCEPVVLAGGHRRRGSVILADVSPVCHLHSSGG